MMLTIVLIVIAVLLFCYYFLLQPQLYWRSKHVKQGLPIPLVGDNLMGMLKRETISDFVIRLYNRHRDSRYSGWYQGNMPILMIRDPDLIKQITVKDFDHFVDHFSFSSETAEPIWSKNLVALKGERWREMRATLSPAFTSSKMRLMFELMLTSAEQYVEYYLKQEKHIVDLEMKDSLTRFSNDVIANCAFGVTVDSLKDPENEFYVKGKELTNFQGLWTTVKIVITMLSPKLAAIFKLSLTSSETTGFFKTLVRDTVNIREEKNIVRPDMINLLMTARKGKLLYEESSEHRETGFATAEESDVGKNARLRQIEITDELMTAQVMIFFFAGFETISTMMSFLCYELAVNPDIQDKLREEIDRSNEITKGKLTYDVLNKLKYLDMVVTESLRKNPPVMAIDRLCTKDYTIEPKLADERPLSLKAGDLVWLPLYAIQHDEEFYPNPSKFDPERFSEEYQDNIKPYTFLSFGAGPRNCIGSRFALMEVKTLIFHILTKFEMVVIEKTTIPMKYDRKQLSPTIEGGCWVGFKRRQDN